MIDIKNLFDEFIESNTKIQSEYIKNIEWIKKRKEVYNKYREIFKEENLDKLNIEEFLGFLKSSNNLSWSGLTRHEPEIRAENDKLNDTLKHLLNEDLKIEDRINNVVNRDGSYHIAGIGEGIATAILHVYNPNEYIVLNSATILAMDLLNISPESTSDTGIEYLESLKNIKKLRDELATDLTTLDCFSYWVTVNQDKIQENEEEFKGKLFHLSREDDLRVYLANNIELVDPNLTILNEGRKFNTGDAGEIDILCQNKSGNYVVIETKR